MSYEDVVVPSVMFVSVFGSLAVILGLYFMFWHRTRAELQKTVRAALEKGQELSPELIERLVSPRRPPHADLRRALIWLAAGVGCVVFAFFVDEQEAVRPIIGLGAFPLLIGIAYLIMSRFSEKDASS
ncbi:MAG TPA: DUF6249 domain-containing protein [Woeseiaceae bacterium]|nr:DUF6249 domain-containing protein [Woeseiaceae bacterium]